jgi:hypothetical protein
MAVAPRTSRRLHRSPLAASYPAASGADPRCSSSSSRGVLSGLGMSSRPQPLLKLQDTASVSRRSTRTSMSMRDDELSTAVSSHTTGRPTSTSATTSASSTSGCRRPLYDDRAGLLNVIRQSGSARSSGRPSGDSSHHRRNQAAHPESLEESNARDGVIEISGTVGTSSASRSRAVRQMRRAPG